MKTRCLILVTILLFAAAMAAGCAKRQLTRSETDRLEAVAAKIAEAEKMGAMECAPRELARAKVALDHAYHEAREKFELYEAAIAEAEKAADELLAKTKPCWEAKQPKPAEAPAPAPPAAPAPPQAAPAPPPEAAPAPPPPVAPAPTPPPEAAPPPVAEIPEVAAFETIHFDFDKSFIRDDAKPILAKVAEYLKKHPEAKLLIEGHCDERGTSEYNMALGDRRAHSARKYLETLGIDGKRISTISYGEERPLDPAHNEEAWARNRRAAFVLK